MSGSTTLLDVIAQSQSSKEVTANDLFNAASPAMLFARRGSLCSGLNWFYYGGTMLVDGVLTAISNNAAALALTASATNYIEATRAGVVSKNTSGFTAGSIPLYTAVCGASSVTSYTDQRAWVLPAGVAQKSGIVMASDANITLTQAQAVGTILSVTSSTSLTTTRNVVVPLAAQQWTVYNGTTGAQALQFIGQSGTGVTVANGKRAIIYADGTNVVRVTADT